MKAPHGFAPALAAIVFIGVSDPVRPAWAYLDPASGSMLLQLLLGGIAGVGVVSKMYWKRVAQWFRWKSRSR